MDIIEVFERWPNEESCIQYLEKIRWPNGPRCPYCKSEKQSPLPDEQRYHCNTCNTSYSVTVGTIFHKTHLPLQKWFLAVSIVLNARKGIAARQLARDLHVHRNTAWRMGMQIRDAMAEKGQRDLLCGIVEMDETFIGGRPRKKPGDPPCKRGRGTDKTPVVGMVSRDGKVVAQVVKKGQVNFSYLRSLVRGNVDVEKTTLVTDAAAYYKRMSEVLPHEAVDHNVCYVRDGWIHTNTGESFWALIKRGIVGQYHKVTVKHLPKYLHEFAYRFSHRDQVDLFGLTIQRALGAA